MESISQIRNRINPNKKGKRIINIFIFIFTLLSFSLGFMIYCRLDEDAKYINSILGTNINFEEFNNTINNIFSFNKSSDTTPVMSTSISYIEHGNNFFESLSGNYIESLYKGRIIGYDEEKLTLVVEYPLSILAVYSYITNVELSNFLFDDEGKFLYVEEGTIIAEYVDRFKVIFLKDNKYMSYQNVINQN